MGPYLKRGEGQTGVVGREVRAGRERVREGKLYAKLAGRRGREYEVGSFSYCRSFVVALMLVLFGGIRHVKSGMGGVE